MCFLLLKIQYQEDETEEKRERVCGGGVTCILITGQIRLSDEKPVISKHSCKGDEVCVTCHVLLYII